MLQPRRDQCWNKPFFNIVSKIAEANCNAGEDASSSHNISFSPE